MTTPTTQNIADCREALIQAEFKLLDQCNDDNGLYQPFFKKHQPDPRIQQLKDDNAMLKRLLEDAVKELATADPDAANKWINRLALTAPFLAAIAFGTATIGGIAASLGFSAVALNELTRDR